LFHAQKVMPLINYDNLFITTKADSDIFFPKWI